MKTLKKYDKNDNIIEWNEYNPKCELEWTFKPKYDDKNNCIEWNKYNSREELVRL